MRPIHNTTNSFISRRRPIASDLLWASLLLLLLVVVGCTPEGDERAQPLPGNVITFTTEGTKADPAFGTAGSTMGIFCFDSKGEIYSNCNNLEVTHNGTAWTYSPAMLWPDDPEEKLTFYAYAPYDENYSDGVFAINENADIDLLIATGTVTKPFVSFTFRHALTKVVVKVQTTESIAGMKVDKIEFSTIWGQGWAKPGDNIQAVGSIPAGGASIAIGKELIPDETVTAEFYMIPQTLSPTAVEDYYDEEKEEMIYEELVPTLAITLTNPSVGGNVVVTHTLTGTTWAAGQTQVYTLEYPKITEFVLTQDGYTGFDIGKAASALFTQSGASADPYLIKNADQMYYFLTKNTAGEFYKLGRDVVLDWSAYPSFNLNASVEFDGDGHTVKTGEGVTIAKGLFNEVGINAKVSNVTVDAIIHDNDMNTGAIGGICNTLNSIILNCTFKGSVKGSGAADPNVGGICGNNKGNVVNCYNYGGVLSNGGYAGGICGVNDGTIHQSCNHSTDITCSNKGGLVGFNRGNVYSCNTTVAGINLIGTGTVTVTTCPGHPSGQ